MPLTNDLEPHDRLLAAVVRQTIRDYETGPWQHRRPARVYLRQLGLIDNTGEVVRATVADVTLLWPQTR